METLNTNTPENKSEQDVNHVAFKAAVESITVPVDRDPKNYEHAFNGYEKVIAEGQVEFDVGSVPFYPVNKAIVQVVEGMQDDKPFTSYSVSLTGHNDYFDSETKYAEMRLDAYGDEQYLIGSVTGDDTFCDHHYGAQGEQVVPGEFFVDSINKLVEIAQKQS